MRAEVRVSFGIKDGYVVTRVVSVNGVPVPAPSTEEIEEMREVDEILLRSDGPGRGVAPKKKKRK